MFWPRDRRFGHGYRAHPSPTVEYIRRHNLKVRTADAEAAKLTGGMVALYPRTADAEQLLIAGSTEKLADLHCTVIYLGEDVRDQDPTELISKLDEVADQYVPFEGNVFSHAHFNPDGDDPCMVYLIGGDSNFTPLFRELKGFVETRYPDAAKQHDPWIPHVTAGYGLEPGDLTYTGPVTFDRIGLRWPDHDQDWTL